MDSHSGRVKFFSALLLFFSLALTSCTPGNAGEEQYGSDRNYFLALKLLDQGSLSKAKKLLSSSQKSKDPLIARRSKEALVPLLTSEKKAKLLTSITETYNDREALTLACSTYLNAEEWSRIIALTNGRDINELPLSVSYARLTSLLKKNDSRFNSEFYSWCTKQAFTQSHYELTRKVNSLPKEIELRKLVFERKYLPALEGLSELAEEKGSLFEVQLVSDLGKAMLYGSNDFLSNASFMEELSIHLSNEGKFYALFYAGRLYDKSKVNQAKASARFMNAFQTAKNKAQSDNAFWYYLKSEMKISPERSLEAIKKYGNSISDPFYYDDFFDELSQKLLKNRMWNLYYQAALVSYGKASKESSAKLNYVAARLIQMGLVKESEENTSLLFNRALDSGSDWYYRTLSAGQLSMTAEEADYVFKNFGHKRESTGEADRLLSGYADFSLAERIYPEWQKVREKTSCECAKKIALYLNSLATEENDYYTQSLRIASWHANHPDSELDLSMLNLVFPRNFSDHMKKVCEEFNIPQYEFYALVRSESFFDPRVKSSAQAKGLSQLMDTTAGDVARKLKVTEYNLSDPYTNLRFGAYYFAELKSRLSGSTLLALFSYNAGIKRVRNWIKESERETGFANLPMDIFLETLPFAETREYGRKNISAAIIYATLYQGIPPYQTIDSLLH